MFVSRKSRNIRQTKCPPQLTSITFSLDSHRLPSSWQKTSCSKIVLQLQDSLDNSQLGHQSSSSFSTFIAQSDYHPHLFIPPMHHLPTSSSDLHRNVQDPNVRPSPAVVQPLSPAERLDSTQSHETHAKSGKANSEMERPLRSANTRESVRDFSRGTCASVNDRSAGVSRDDFFFPLNS